MTVRGREFKEFSASLGCRCPQIFDNEGAAALQILEHAELRAGYESKTGALRMSIGQTADIFTEI
ncbi:MAG: hypothetical protein JKY15_05615 [Deltaproteobacteria bacterium]|nr:hypothetical protein [Deltaproteobacteria bacterium]